MIPALSGTPPAGVRVLIATRPVDFRRGADSLAAMAWSSPAARRFEFGGGVAGPERQGRPINRNALPRQDLGLAV